MDRTGQTLLGKYELAKQLGKGGMGEVWQGEHLLTGRRVAVKILGEAHLGNPKIVARFGREARVASAVQHRGIVEILDQDVTPEGVPFLVMEFLEGESLGDRIKRVGRLAEQATLAVVLPLLSALEAAHAAGVIHRDLKPDNVFLSPGSRGVEQVKILDFGISRKADEVDHHLTQEGSVLGTPHYMSPEQARGELTLDLRADIYAVGVLIYECLTGQVPFDAKNYNALLQRILSESPPSLRAQGLDVSAGLERVVASAMAKNRKDRPASAAAMRALLLDAQNVPEPPPKAVAERPPAQAAELGLASLRPARPAAQVAELGRAPLRSGAAAGASSAEAVAPLDADLLAGAVAREPSLAPPAGASHDALSASRGEVGSEGSPFPFATPQPLERPLDAVREGSGARRRISTPRPQSPGTPTPRPQSPRAPTWQSQPGDRPLKAPGEGPSEFLRAARGAAGWLLAVLALLLLAYVGRAVFRRPDTRRARHVESSSAEPVTGPSEGVGAVLPPSSAAP